MSEYIPKYPSEEGDDSNKTSSELLAKTLKPIYVPQELMLAWESHLASYSRDTNELLDQVKDSEDALNTQYQALLARVQKYEQMLQDITMDSNEFTMDTDEVNFTGWNILAQASYWDYLLRKEITKLSDQIKSVAFKGELVADVSDSVLESLSTGNQYISNIIGALTDNPLIRDLDAALSGTSTGLSELRAAHEALRAKQYADAKALAEQNGQTFDELSLIFNDAISEQIDRIADEAATRTSLIQELEDGITLESQLRHEGQETIATAVFALKASTDTSIAGIKQEYSTIAGTNEAITSALTTYTAEVDGTISTILTDYVAYATLDSALTSKSDKLLAIVNDNIGKLNITNEIQAGLTSIKALSTVSVDLNGVVSGYGLISELENGIVKSAFGVNADTFYIGKPTDAVKPFVVTSVPTTIDGIDFPTGTWINSAIIANATIGSAHIKDASITNAHIRELDASKITTGILEARRIRVGDTTQFDFGYAPTDVLNGAKTYTDTKTKTFTAQPTTPYSSGDIYRNGASIYVCTTARASGSYVASDWILVGDVTANNTAADANKLGGTAASTVLDNAAKGIAVYNDVMSDLKITPVEKTSLNTEWTRIKAEYSSMLAHAASMAVSTTDFTSAYNALNSTSPTMTSIFSSMSTTTTLTAAQRDALRTQFANYYTQVTAVDKAISDKVADNAKAYTDAIEVGATNLLYKSYDSSLWTAYGSPIFSLTSDAYYTQDSVLYTQTTFEGSGGTDTLKVYRQGNNLEVGKTLTMSAYVKNRGTKNLTVNAAGLNAVSALTVASGKMERIVFTGTLTQATTQFRILTVAAADAFAVDIIDLKFEYGNKATSWTPSPAEVNALIDSKAKTYLTTPTVPYSAGDIWKDGATTKVALVFRGTGSFTASDWILAGDVTAENTARDTTLVNGISATTVANNAQTGKTLSDNIMSDLVITPVEKSSLLTEWNRIKAEYTSIVAEATALSIDKTALDTAYTALDTTSPRIASEILASMTTNYVLTATTRDAFKSQLNAYFVQATTVSKAITNKVTSLVGVAQNTANSKAKVFTSTPTVPYVIGDVWKEGATVKIAVVSRTTGSYTASDWNLVGDVTANNTSADTAKVNGINAATVASNAANGATVYADAMSDLKITPVEKTAINQEWNRIQQEYTFLLAQAQALSLTTTPYTSAYTNLSTAAPAMSTILASMTTTTTLTAAERDAYKTQYTTYYTQAAAITKAINDKIAANAKSYVDNVQIGGANLALNTGRELNQHYWAVPTTSPLTVGKEYTISFDYIGNVNGRVFLNNSVDKNYPAINSTTWIRASVTFVFVKNDYQGVELFPHVYGATKLRNLKLESGNKATDWTPAPEDIDSDISSAKSAAAAANVNADSAINQLALWKYPNSTYIDGGKIYTDSITANQISVDSLSAISSNLGTIEVGTANIANGAITNAKIGNLEVDTLKIANNAVTVPVYSYMSGIAYIDSQVWTTSQSIWSPCSNGVTLFFFNFSYDCRRQDTKYEVKCRILKNGVIVKPEFTIFFFEADFNASNIESRPAGTLALNHLDSSLVDGTFELQFYVSSGNGWDVNNRYASSLTVRR